MVQKCLKSQWCIIWVAIHYKIVKFKKSVHCLAADYPLTARQSIEKLIHPLWGPKERKSVFGKLRRMAKRMESSMPREASRQEYAPSCTRPQLRTSTGFASSPPCGAAMAIRHKLHAAMVGRRGKGRPHWNIGRSWVKTCPQQSVTLL